MSADRWRRLREIYDTVADAPPADRPRLLDELCGEDAGLRAEVEALLDADGDSHSWLDDSLVAFVTGAFAPGDVLCDRFELLHLAGRGGMGEVWAAHDRTSNSKVAVKTIASSFMTGPEGVARFTREVQLALRVAHPNVCRVHALFEDRSGPAPRLFLTMELLDGQTLAALLQKDTRLPADQAIWILGELLKGLAVAHAAGVVHRDLKPGNIMLVPGGDAPRVVIMDFGLARTAPSAAPSTNHSNTQVPVGTPEYMAPEQLSGREISAATDVYALGVILFELLTGAPPFRSATPLESIMRRAREAPRKLAGEVPGVTPAIDAVIAKALAFEPKDRFASVDAMRVALDAKRAPARPGRTITLPSRRVAIATGVGLGIVTAGAIGLLWMRPVAAAPSPDAIRRLDYAHQGLAEGANVRAYSDAQQAVKAAPAYAPAYAVLAETLLELEMPGRAEQAIVTASIAAPDRASLPADQQDYVAGVQALVGKNCEAAIRYFTSRSAPPSADRALKLMTTARAYERCERPVDADRTLREAAELDDRNPAVPLRRARLLGRGKKIDDAMAAFALAESVFLERGNMEGVAEVHVSKGALEIVEGRLGEADVTLAKASDIVATQQDMRLRIRVDLQRGILRRRQNRLDEALELSRDTVALARRSDLEAMAIDGIFNIGSVHLTRLKLPDALKAYEEALAVAEANRNEAQSARGWLSLASVYARLMDPARTMSSVAAARPFFERAQHLTNLANADVFEGQARLMRGDIAASIDHFGRMAAVARGRTPPSRTIEATALNERAGALTDAGRLPEALDTYRAELRLRDAVKEARPIFYGKLSLSETFSKLGAFADAESVLPALPGGPAAPELESRYRFVLAGHHYRQGFTAKALVEAERARILAEGMLERRARITLLACVLAAHAGAPAKAAERCGEAQDIVGPTGHTMLKLEAALAAAEAAFVARDLETARKRIDDAALLIGDGPHEARWRLLALRSAVDGATKRAGSANREALSRELERLRLEWGDPSFAGWQRRADVRRLLEAAGPVQEAQTNE